MELLTNIPTESYFEFKIKYYKHFPKSTYRFGQAWICRYIKKEDNSEDYDKLWNSNNIEEIENIIFSLIRKNNWCIMSLKPIRNIFR